MTNILVVEDQRIVARDLAETLVSLGYDVSGIASSGEEAIELARSTRPDAVLMDIRLQGAMDGVAAAARITDELDVPVIYLTAYADLDTIARAKTTSPFGYLVKPIKENDLRSALEIALHNHAATAALRGREHWLASILRSIGDAVITTDVDGRITFLNPAAQQITGYDLQQVLGRPVADVMSVIVDETGMPVHWPTPSSEELRGAPTTVTGRLTSRDGTSRSVSVSVAPMVEENGRTAGASIVFHDVEERTKLESRLMHADRLASVGMLTAGVAHEINNPLAYITASLGDLAEQLERSGPPAEEETLQIDEVLAEALQGLERVRSVVRDLKTFGASGAHQLEVVDVHSALEKAENIVFNELRHRALLHRDYRPTPPVTADENRLVQVFLNLLLAAARGLPEGNVNQNEIRVRAFTGPKGEAVVEVEDTGTGMPDGEGRLDGVLGIPIVRRIVEEYRGTLLVNRQPGVGSRFTVTLPGTVVHRARDPEAARRRPPPPAVAGGKVLVIDDEPAIRRALRRMLAPEQEVVEEGSGAAAVARIVAGERFDAILCDLMMPELSGVDVYDAVLDASPDQANRMIFMTGGAFSPRALSFLREVANLHVEKPFDVTELRRVVASTVALSG